MTARTAPRNRSTRGYPPVMSKQNFSKGDKVTWQSHGSTAEGTVEEKITSDTEAAGRTVRASKDEPQYRVRSDKSGNDAVHKPEALKKKS
ncbi:hypothetical protein MDUV_52300 [Mycolicibacterium duvalii]|uniref:Hypervirulence associated protein TUDOR domain-containing protein n=2 Tax=Mycolicibacterium duvalii TaxID=39688 RepID=A0A7I7K863_9MYCO|nr:hypothetical protein MDUV_52300 [Mycolicibacterium duvalii]